MSFYTKMRMTAYKLLKGKGQLMTLTRQSAGTYGVSNATASISTSTQTVYGAVFPYADKNIDGTLIKAGDKQLLMAAINAAGGALTPPVLNDTVTIDSVVYTITQVKPLSPAGITVIYDCNIRV